MTEEFVPHSLLQSLQQNLQKILDHSGCQPNWVVAYSGGADSSALLHAMAGLCPHQPGWQVRAIHINHQLQEQASQWQQHCEQFCAKLQVDLTLCTVDVDKQTQGLEAAARQARYQAFAQQLGPEEVLLMAHHADDQSETVLFQLTRGAGPRGMAGMPLWRREKHYHLGRPLLDCCRQQIVDYCQHQQIRWVEDPSNQSLQMDRNFLRLQVLPLLQQRWPGLNQRLALSSELFAQSMQLSSELARLDNGEEYYSAVFSLVKLRELSVVRQKNLLLHWLREAHEMSLSPGQLDQLLGMVDVRRDAAPVLCVGGREIRLYQQALYVLEPSVSFALPTLWDWRQPVQTSIGLLQARVTLGQGIRRSLLTGSLELRQRAGGEKMAFAGGGTGRHSLKKLFQQWRIPPWQRDIWPLLYLDGELVCVPGFRVAAGFQAAADEEGVVFSID